MGNFERSINYKISQPGGEQILLTATMRDVYHDILLEVKVRFEDLVITGLNVEFFRAPETLCVNASKRLQNMVGIKIGKGLTKAIMNCMGGSEGCVNLRHLLSGLLPLAMNVKAAAGEKDERVMLDNIRDALAGACSGYPPKEQKENNDKSYIC